MCSWYCFFFFALCSARHFLRVGCTRLSGPQRKYTFIHLPFFSGTYCPNTWIMSFLRRGYVIAKYNTWLGWLMTKIAELLGKHQTIAVLVNKASNFHEKAINDHTKSMKSYKCNAGCFFSSLWMDFCLLFFNVWFLFCIVWLSIKQDGCYSLPWEIAFFLFIFYWMFIFAMILEIYYHVVCIINVVPIISVFKILWPMWTASIKFLNHVYLRVNPKWVIYQTLVSTDKLYMRNVIAIDPSWLTEAAPHFYTQK